MRHDPFQDMRSRNDGRRLPRIVTALLACASFTRGESHGQVAQRVADLAPEWNGVHAGFTPIGMVAGNGRVWCSANELWTTDGTASGTVPVVDLEPTGASVDGSDPQDPLSPFGVEVNGVFLYRAKTRSTGYELYRSDGTAANTTLVKDITPGVTGSYPSQFFALNGRAFFFAFTSSHGVELWSSDGAADGTIMVKDIRPGTESGIPSVTHIIVDGKYLYFAANDGTHGTELWRTDGTEAGTIMLADIAPSGAGSNPFRLTPMGGRVYFIANAAELWATDGTPGGTTRVASPWATSTGPRTLTALGSLILFDAGVEGEGRELWVSDGTEVGTHVVVPRSLADDPQMFKRVGSRVFFVAGQAGVQGLYATDGTPAGTTRLSTIVPTSSAEAVGSRLVFNASVAGKGLELCASDGTAAGTGLVRDINLGSASSSPSRFTVFNGSLLFQADDGANGMELWISDGTSAGTSRITDVSDSTADSGPRLLTDADGVLYFAANDSIYMTDGTIGGTREVVEPLPGMGQSSITEMVAVGPKVFFPANHFSRLGSSIQLWVADGTDAGTHPVLGMPPAGASLPWRLFAFGDRVFYLYSTPENGTALWSSDGTPSGTAMVKDIRPDNGSLDFGAFATAGGKLFFSASDGVSGHELWLTDGTDAGTFMVKDINPGSASGLLRQDAAWRFADVGGVLLFTAGDSTTGYELWKSDGTESGTTLVKDINPGVDGSVPLYLCSLHGVAYFRISTATADNGLWRSDGTDTGTQLVKAVPFGTNVENITSDGTRLLFTMHSGVGPVELWTSDGTTAGTVKVRDLLPNRENRPGGFCLTPGAIHRPGAPFFVVGYDALTGLEMFKSDGTQAGTSALQCVPGVLGCAPLSGVVSGARLYFSADDGQSGVELWSISLCPGDVNSDGLVDASDLDAFISSWVEARPEADLNGDGFVDAMDYDVFAKAFANGC